MVNTRLKRQLSLCTYIDTLIYSRINKAWARQATTLIVDMTQRCGVLMLLTERAGVGSTSALDGLESYLAADC